MAWTLQTLLKTKLFGDYLTGTRPLQYRVKDWQEMVRGKERATRLIVKSMLGVPSAHHGDQDQQMWCFQFEDGGLLVIYLHRGNGQVQIATKGECPTTDGEVSAKDPDSPDAGSKDLVEALDFLFGEMVNRLRAL